MTRRGRVEDDEVVGATARGAPRLLGELQTLPTVSSSRIPGVAAVKYPKSRDRFRRSASGRAGRRSRRYSSSADSGSIEMWCRPSPRRALGLVVLVVAAQRAREVVAGGDLGHDRAQSPPRGDDPERGGDRGLAGAALAGDDHEVLGQEPAGGGRGRQSFRPSSPRPARRGRAAAPGRPCASGGRRRPRPARGSRRPGRSARARRRAARARRPSPRGATRCPARTGIASRWAPSPSKSSRSPSPSSTWKSSCSWACQCGGQLQAPGGMTSWRTPHRVEPRARPRSRSSVTKTPLSRVSSSTSTSAVTARADRRRAAGPGHGRRGAGAPGRPRPRGRPAAGRRPGAAPRARAAAASRPPVARRAPGSPPARSRPGPARTPPPARGRRGSRRRGPARRRRGGHVAPPRPWRPRPRRGPARHGAGAARPRPPRRARRRGGRDRPCRRRRARLTLPVRDLLDAGPDAQAAQRDLLRARVEGRVAGLALPVGQQPQAAWAGTEGVGHAGAPAGRATTLPSRTGCSSSPSTDGSRRRAHHEQLLLGAVAVRRSAQRPGLDVDDAQAGHHGLERAAGVAQQRGDIAVAPALRGERVDRDDRRRPPGGSGGSSSGPAASSAAKGPGPAGGTQCGPAQNAPARGSHVSPVAARPNAARRAPRPRRPRSCGPRRGAVQHDVARRHGVRAAACQLSPIRPRTTNSSSSSAWTWTGSPGRRPSR